MSDKIIQFGDKSLTKGNDDNLSFDGNKVLDEGNALFSDIQDVNIPTELTQADDGKVIEASYTAPDVYGNETDGDLEVSSPTSVSTCASLTTDTAPGSTTIYVDSTAGFSDGDEIVIMNMQVYRQGSVSSLGIHEYATIQQVVNSTTLLLSSGISNEYLSDSSGNKQNNTKAQITKVWQWNVVTLDDTLSCSAWNGSKGGVLAFRAKTLLGSGDISANYTGYTSNGYVGEGYFGLTSQPTGGGEKGPYLSSWGGGGHLNAGNANSGTGGAAYGLTVEQVTTNPAMGGGGSQGNGSPYPSGWSGGGIILCFVQDNSAYTGQLTSIGGYGACGSVVAFTNSATSFDISVVNGGSGGSAGRSYSGEPSQPPTRQYQLGPKVSTDVNDSNAEIPTSKAVRDNFLALDGSNEMAGDLVPDGDGTRNLGSPTNRWASVYVSGASVHMGDSTLSINGENLDLDGKKVLDDNNALFSDIQDVNIPTELTLADNGKIIEAYYAVPDVYGDASDGDLAVSSPTSMDICASLTADVSPGATTIYVDDTTGFTAGDEILLINMQVYRQGTVNALGLHEFLRISQVLSSTSILLSTSIVGTYLSDLTGDKENNTKAQIVKVWNWGTLTLNDELTCFAWNGYKGGVLAFRAQTIAGVSNVSVDAKGYRPSYPGWPSPGYCEGYFGRNSTESGGGGRVDCDINGGTGAGGHLNAGGTCGPRGCCGGGYAYGLAADTARQNPAAGGGGRRWDGYYTTWRDSGGGIIIAYISDNTNFSGKLVSGPSSARSDEHYGASGTVVAYTNSSVPLTVSVNGSHQTGTQYGSVGRSYAGIPSEQPTRLYQLGPKVSTTLDDGSDVELPTSKAVATYVAGKFLEPLPVRQVDQASYTITSADFGHLLDVVYTGGPVTITVDAGVMSPYDEFTVNRLTPQLVAVVGGTGVSVNGTPQGNGSIDDEFMMAAVRCYGTNLLQLVGNVTVT